jgi:hypothetical protein
MVTVTVRNRNGGTKNGNGTVKTFNNYFHDIVLMSTEDKRTQVTFKFFIYDDLALKDQKKCSKKIKENKFKKFIPKTIYCDITTKFLILILLKENETPRTTLH